MYLKIFVTKYTSKTLGIWRIYVFYQPIRKSIFRFDCTHVSKGDTMTKSTKLKYLTQETSYTLKSLQQKYQKSNPESRKEKES
jgi:hypothetical protein